MEFKKSILLFIFSLTVFIINAQTLTVEITNIRNNKGRIIVAVFKNNDDFKNEKTVVNKICPKNLKNHSMTVKIKLTPGIYGISILDDENCDSKMEYNFIGLPKEGYGFSNFYHKGISRPQFTDFDFSVSNKNKIVKVKMKYF